MTLVFTKGSLKSAPTPVEEGALKTPASEIPTPKLIFTKGSLNSKITKTVTPEVKSTVTPEAAKPNILEDFVSKSRSLLLKGLDSGQFFQKVGASEASEIIKEDPFLSKEIEAKRQQHTYERNSSGNIIPEFRKLPDAGTPEWIAWKVKNLIITPFVQSSEQIEQRRFNKDLIKSEFQKQGKAITDGELEKNYDDLAYSLDLAGPTPRKVLRDVMGPAAVVGALAASPTVGAAALSLGLGVAAFAGINEVDRALTALTKGKKYEAFKSDTFAESLVPNEASDFTKFIFELGDFAVKGGALHGFYKVAPKLAEAATKQKLTTYEIGHDVYIPADAFVEVMTGAKTGKSTAEQADMLKSLDLSRAEVLAAKDAGIKVKVAAEKIVTTADKPWWSKLKQAVGMKEAEPTVTTDRPGETQKTFGLLENKGYGEPPVEKAPTQAPAGVQEPQGAPIRIEGPSTPPEKAVVPTAPREGVKPPYEMTQEEFKKIPIIKYINDRLGDKKNPLTVQERDQLGQQLVDQGLMSINDFNTMTGQHGFGGPAAGVKNLTTGKPIPSKPIEGQTGEVLNYIGQWQTFRNIPDFAHRESIVKALAEGKTVPKEVLNEYKDWKFPAMNGDVVDLKEAVESYGGKLSTPTGEGTVLYRGGRKYSEGEITESGVSFTLNKDTATNYKFTKGSGSVQEFVLDPGAKIYKPDITIEGEQGYLMHEGKRIDKESIVKKARAEGYDAVDFTKLHEEIRVLNPKMVKPSTPTGEGQSLGEVMGSRDKLELGVSNILGSPAKVSIVRVKDTDTFGDVFHSYKILFEGKDQQILVPVGQEGEKSNFLKSFNLQEAEDRLRAFNEANPTVGGEKLKLQERISPTGEGKVPPKEGGEAEQIPADKEKITPEKEKIISSASEYVVQVTKTQGRLLSFDDLWKGYQSTHKNGLTKEGFQLVYDSVKEISKEIKKQVPPVQPPRPPKKEKIKKVKESEEVVPETKRVVTYKTESVEKTIKTVISKKSPLPILMLSKVAGGKIQTTDLEVFFEKKTDLKPGMYELIGKDFVKGEGPGFDPQDFPDPPYMKDAVEGGSVDKNEFIKELERALPFTSDDETRLVLGGIHLAVKNGIAKIEATDGRRLSIGTFRSPNLKDGDYILGSPKKVLNALKGLEGKSLTLRQKEYRMELTSDDGRVILNMIEGEFPNTSQVWPEIDTQVSLSKKDLLNAIKEIEPYYKKTQNERLSVAVTFDNDKVRISTTGSVNKVVEIPVKKKINKWVKPRKTGQILLAMETQSAFSKIGINLNYLKDAVNSVGGENVFWGLNTTSIDEKGLQKPFVFYGEEISGSVSKLSREGGTLGESAPTGEGITNATPAPIQPAPATQGEPKNVEGGPVSSDVLGLFEDIRASIPISNYETQAKTGLSKPDAFKISQATVDVYDAVNKSLDIEATLGEGKLPRGARGRTFLGVQYNPSHNIRTVGLGAVSTNNHELLHRIEQSLRIMDRVISETERGSDIRKQLTQVYVKFYPGGKVDHKLEKRLVEGYATLGEEYTARPTVIQRDYPLLVQAFLKPGGRYYHAAVGIAQNGFRKIVDDYQRLDPLAKFGSRITDQQTTSEKSNFLTVWDKIKTEAFDNLWPVEKLDIAAEVGDKRVGVSLAARMFNNANSIIYGNLNGSRGFWNLDENGEFKKVLDYNIGGLVQEVEKNGDAVQFGWWLISRRVMNDYKSLKETKTLLEQAQTALEDLKLSEYELQVKLNDIPKVEGKTPDSAAPLLEQLKLARKLLFQGQMVVKQLTAQVEAIQTIISNDGWTELEATEAHGKYSDQYNDYAIKYDALTRENLRLISNPLVQLLEPARALRYMKREGYASMKREFYDEFIGDEEISGAPQVGKNKVSSLIGRHGSKRNVINPLMSLAKDHAEIMRKSMRQIVYNKLVSMVDVFPALFQPEALKPVPDRTGKMLFPQEKDPNIIMARKNYKRFPIRTTSELKRVFDETLNFQNMNFFEKLMMSTSRFFSRSTTGLYLQFFISNIPIDQISAAAQTKNGYIPVYDTIKEIGKALTKRGSVEAGYLNEYLFLGGEKHTFVGWQSLTPQEFIEKLTNERTGLLKVMDAINRGAELMSIPSQWSEIATRGTEYIKARKAGKHQWAAMEDAGRVSVPFHHYGRFGQGTWGTSFVRSIPYLNPSIQALGYAAERATNKDSAARYWTVAMAVTAASVFGMAYSVENASEEQKQQLRDLNPELLANYIYLPYWGGKGLLRIRIPEQIGVIGTMINMVIMDEMLDAKYSLGEYGAAATSFLPNQVDPTNMGKLVLSWIPQILKPLWGVIANIKDFPNVRPVEGLGMQAMEPRYRQHGGTSAVAKSLGNEMPVIGDIANKLGLSPIKIDFLLDSYLGRGITQFAGKEVRNPAYQKYYFEGGRMLQRYFQIREETSQQINTIRNNRGDFLPEEISAIGQKYGILKGAEQLLSAYRKVSRETENSTQTEEIRTKLIMLIDRLLVLDNSLNQQNGAR